MTLIDASLELNSQNVLMSEDLCFVMYRRTSISVVQLSTSTIALQLSTISDVLYFILIMTTPLSPPPPSSPSSIEIANVLISEIAMLKQSVQYLEQDLASLQNPSEDVLLVFIDVLTDMLAQLNTVIRRLDNISNEM